MGVFDKLKKVLFDEEEIEVPISSDELPERQPKKVEEPKVNNTHVIDHSSDEEDTIKEVKVPEDNPNDNRIKFPIDDFEDIDNIPSRSSVHDTFEERRLYTPEEPSVDIREERVKEYHRNISPISDRTHEIKEKMDKESTLDRKKTVNPPEPKDYKKIIEDNDDNGKKPFKVSPVISPVFGILDKNYTPEEVTEKREIINKINTGVKPRTFGPVSYNDEPLPAPHKYKVGAPTTLKEDLVELNSTVTEIISDTVTPSSVKDDDSIDMPAYAPGYEEDDDPVLVTENYNEITSGIEDEYLGNNNIEDAFETTSEYDKITENDNNSIKQVEQENDDTIKEDIPTYEVKETKEENPADDDNENLEDTIETDLFHLIDSMYQSKDDEEDSEEEE